MRFTPLLILVPTLVLSACGKKDLEPEPEPVPAPTPTPVRSAEPRNLLAPGAANPFRVPDATKTLPDADATRSIPNPPLSPTAPANETATVKVRPPETPTATGNTE
jgi:hypothetical protein